MIEVKDLIDAIGYNGKLWGFVLHEDGLQVVEHLVSDIKAHCVKIDFVIILASAKQVQEPNRLCEIWIQGFDAVDPDKVYTNKGVFFLQEAPANSYRDAYFAIT